MIAYFLDDCNINAIIFINTTNFFNVDALSKVVIFVDPLHTCFISSDDPATFAIKFSPIHILVWSKQIEKLILSIEINFNKCKEISK